MNSIEILNSVLEEFEVRDYTLLSNKVIIKGNLSIDDEDSFTKIGSLPFQFYVKGELFTFKLLDNVHPVSSLVFYNYRSEVIDKDVSTSESVSLSSSDITSMSSLHSTIRSESITLNYFKLNGNLIADEIDVKECVIQDSTISCRNYLELYNNHYKSNLYIDGCENVVLNLKYGMVNTLYFSNIEKLIILSYEDLSKKLFKLSFNNIKHLKLSMFSLLTLFNSQIYVDTLEIDEVYFNKVFLKIPTTPLIVCNKLLLYEYFVSDRSLNGKRTYINEYPKIKDIEKFIKLKDVN